MFYIYRLFVLYLSTVAFVLALFYLASYGLQLLVSHWFCVQFFVLALI